MAFILKPNQPISVLTRSFKRRFILFRSPVKPCLVKYFKWVLKLSKGKGQRAGKDKGLAKGQITRVTLEAQKVACPENTVASFGDHL